MVIISYTIASYALSYVIVWVIIMLTILYLIYNIKIIIQCFIHDPITIKINLINITNI